MQVHCTCMSLQNWCIAQCLWFYDGDMCLHSLNYYTAAVVGLETTFYQVSENVGVVNVCAVVRNPPIMCPIAFPFNVNLSTADKSAGNVCIHVQQWPWFSPNMLCVIMYLNFFASNNTSLKDYGTDSTHCWKSMIMYCINVKAPHNIADKSLLMPQLRLFLGATFHAPTWVYVHNRAVDRRLLNRW